MNHEDMSDESDFVDGQSSDESNSVEGDINYESSGDDRNSAEGHINYESMSYQMYPVEGNTNYATTNFEIMSCKVHSVEWRTPPAVVGDEYVVQNRFVLNTVKKRWGYSLYGDFSVLDENKNCVFRAHRSSDLSTTIVLRDTNDVPVLCLHKKALFSFGNWKVYSGSEPRRNALLFRWKTYRLKNKIFLKANVAREIPDYTVKMRWYGHSFKVFNHQALIAEAKQHRFRLGRKRIFITAVPNVDQALMAAILVLMEEQFEEGARKKRAGAAGAAVDGANATGGGGGA